jgi:hypothetical protein
MIHRSGHRAIHWPSLVTLLRCMVILLCMAGITVAAVVGDHVELQASHQAGVPFHQEPRGTNDFQRVPDGTRAQVIDVAKGGQWLKLSLSDGRTGWVTWRYIRSSGAESPSTGTSPAAPRPQRIEEGMVERVADGDTLTVITANQTKLRIRMFGIDAPETPRGTKFPGQPYGKEAEAYLKQLVEGKRVKVEIYDGRPLQAALLHDLPGREGHQSGDDRSGTRLGVPGS